MSIVVQGTGGDVYLARLKRLASPALNEAIGESLVESANALMEDIRVTLNENSISGPGHIVSEPGEPPNSDTHKLEQSLRVSEIMETDEVIQTAVLEGDDDAPYALFLEYGTSTPMAERPHMGPAAERARPSVRDGLRAAIAKVAQGS